MIDLTPYIEKAESETGQDVIAACKAQRVTAGKLGGQAGLLCATDEELVFVAEGLLEPGRISLTPRSLIQQCELASGALDATLSFETDTGQLVFSRADQEDAAKLHAALTATTDASGENDDDPEDGWPENAWLEDEPDETPFSDFAPSNQEPLFPDSSPGQFDFNDLALPSITAPELPAPDRSLASSTSPTPELPSLAVTSPVADSLELSEQKGPDPFTTSSSAADSATDWFGESAGFEAPQDEQDDDEEDWQDDDDEGWLGEAPQDQPPPEQAVSQPAEQSPLAAEQPPDAAAPTAELAGQPEAAAGLSVEAMLAVLEQGVQVRWKKSTFDVSLEQFVEGIQKSRFGKKTRFRPTDSEQGFWRLGEEEIYEALRPPPQTGQPRNREPAQPVFRGPNQSPEAPDSVDVSALAERLKASGKPNWVPWLIAGIGAVFGFAAGSVFGGIALFVIGLWVGRSFMRKKAAAAAGEQATAEAKQARTKNIIRAAAFGVALLGFQIHPVAGLVFFVIAMIAGHAIANQQAKS